MSRKVRDELARTVEACREGAVLWFGDLPRHPTVRSAIDEGEPEAEAPFLTVDRAPRLVPPASDERLAVWLDGPRDDPDTDPCSGARDGQLFRQVEHLDEQPEVAVLFRSWLRD